MISKTVSFGISIRCYCACVLQWQDLILGVHYAVKLVKIRFLHPRHFEYFQFPAEDTGRRMWPTDFMTVLKRYVSRYQSMFGHGIPTLRGVNADIAHKTTTTGRVERLNYE